jgi:hypothetical protein
MLQIQLDLLAAQAAEEVPVKQLLTLLLTLAVLAPPGKVAMVVLVTLEVHM